MLFSFSINDVNFAMRYGPHLKTIFIPSDYETMSKPQQLHAKHFYFISIEIYFYPFSVIRIFVFIFVLFENCYKTKTYFYLVA